MIDNYLNIQLKLNHYSCYIKNLVASLCTEFQTDKVHVRRLTSVLERLVANEDESFKAFFNYEKPEIEMQIIQYITQLGEILHLGDGYYTLPPERAIQMPDGRFFLVSSSKSSSKTFGLASHTEEATKITLSYQQYLHRPTFDEILTVYGNELLSNHDIEPTEMIYVNSTGTVRTKRITNMRENEFYILLFERSFKNAIKLERYLARWENNEWHVAEIKSISHYFRLRLALSFRMKQVYTYKLIHLKKDHIELQMNFLLPEEEHRLLRLIATPEHFKWPKRYIFTSDQLQNIEEILSHCHFKREEH